MMWFLFASKELISFFLCMIYYVYIMLDFTSLRFIQILQIFLFVIPTMCILRSKNITIIKIDLIHSYWFVFSLSFQLCRFLMYCLEKFFCLDFSVLMNARNFSNFASKLCQHCQKTIPFVQTSSSNFSSCSGLPTTLTSNLTSLPKCSRFGSQNIRHSSKQKHPSQNESAGSKGDKIESSKNETSCSEENKDEDEIKEKTHQKKEETMKCVPIVPDKGPPPDPPLDCCMSGCANCVWIKYAEEMRDYYCEDGIEKALKDIEKIEDVNLKAYLKLELSFINKWLSWL